MPTATERRELMWPAANPATIKLGEFTSVTVVASGIVIRKGSFWSLNEIYLPEDIAIKLRDALIELFPVQEAVKDG